MDSLTPIRRWPAIISLVIPLTIWFVIPCPPVVTPQAWHLLALFIGTIAAIIGKAMPIGAIAIVAIMLVAMTGVTNPGKPSAALNDALSGFSNQLIWLIGLSIMLSQSLLKTGLGARIGYGFIALFGKRTLGIAWALTLAETLIAPVTPSNTARGGGIIHPVMRAIAESLGSQPGHAENGSTGRYLALVNYNINPISYHAHAKCAAVCAAKTGCAGSTFFGRENHPGGVHFAALSMGGCSSNADGQCLERKPH